MSKYVLNGKEIYSEKGKLVATLDADGNPVMAPGMAGPHSRGVREFLSAGAERNVESLKLPPSPEATEDMDAEGSACASLPPSPEATEDMDAGETKVYVGKIPAAKAEGGEPEAEKKPETLEEYSVSTIPESELPPFSKEYGVNTEGFREFVQKYRLTGSQVAALIRRLLN